MNIPIKNGIVKIDEEDLALVSKYKWHVNDAGYAVWRGIEDGVKKTIRMHRLILDTPKHLMTDHINHDRLDNRKSNIRVCTHSENMRNLTNQGKGYNLHSQNGNWNVETNGVRIGGFKTEEEAKEVVELLRSGGTYKKPERLECSNGHKFNETGYYIINNRKMCKPCQSERSRRYYVRKTKR